MSCTNGTSPIDINITNVLNNCDLKCNYSYEYSNVNPIISNNSDYLKLTYENTSKDSVIYNTYDFYVKEIRIYTPSLHSYNSQKTDAEMIIIHSSKLGQPDLLVCIPIKNTNANTDSSNLITTIVNTASSATPSSGLSTTLNTSNFNLNTFILSNKPFYSYTATLPFQPCNSNVNFVVFSIVNGNIDITNSTLNKLQNIVATNNYTTNKGTNLFYNPKGSNNSNLGNNDIYIDCQPTDSSEEQKEVVVEYYTTSPITFDLIKNNVYFKIFSFTFILLLIIFVFYFILHKTTGINTQFRNVNN